MPNSLAATTPNSQHLPSPSAGNNQSPGSTASPDRSKDELSDFINLFNKHDEFNKVYCNMNEISVDFFDVTISQDSGFSNHLFWTLRYILRTWTYMNYCIKSLFIQNICLKGSWNPCLSDSPCVIARKTFMKPRQFYSSAPQKTILLKQIL